MKKKQTHQPPWVKHQQRRVAQTTPNPARNISSLWDGDQGYGGGSIHLQPVAHMPASHTDGKVMRCARSREPAPGLCSFKADVSLWVLLPRK